MEASQGTNSPALSAVFCSPLSAVGPQHSPKSSQIWGLNRAAEHHEDGKQQPQSQPAQTAGCIQQTWCTKPMGMGVWGPQHRFGIGRPGFRRDLEQVIHLLCNTEAEVFLINCSVRGSIPLLIKACGYKSISMCNFHQRKHARPRLWGSIKYIGRLQTREVN